MEGSTPREPSGARSWLPLAGAIALLVAVGIYAGRLQTRTALLGARLDQTRGQLEAATNAVRDAAIRAREAEAVMAVLADPASVELPLAGRPPAPGAGGRTFWGERGLVVTAWGLPPPPAGRVYQVWIGSPDESRSLGLLDVDPTGTAATHFSASRPVRAPVFLSVTLEPAGGAPVPTGEPYLSSQDATR